MNSTAIIQSMRLPFLVLPPACVFLGASASIAEQGDVSLVLLALSLVGALLAHISVNALNEYCDFKSGLDLKTQRTPFSGGSGALLHNPDALKSVLALGIITLTATAIIGVYFIWLHGAAIVPIGVAGLLLIVAYTPWLNKDPLLCLVAPGIGFGYLMVAGTGFVLQGEYSLLPWLVAVIPFCLSNNLLLLNQYPDIEADKSAGRNHLPIVYGVKFGNGVYAFFLLVVLASIVIYIFKGYLPALSLIALLPIPLGFYALLGAVKYGANIGRAPQYLAANVAVSILTPLLLGLSIIFG